MSDSLDHLITDAFVEFDAAERGAFEPAPGTSAVRRTVARRRRVVYTSVGAAVVMLVAVPVAIFANTPRGSDPPPVIVGSTSPRLMTPSPSATPSPTATTPPTVLNATLALPAFPGLADECGKAGTRTFVNGVAELGDSVTWSIGAMVPIQANLDGVAGQELVTTIRCDTPGSVHVTQLLALKVAAGGTLSALGYVINSPDVRNLFFASQEVRVEGGVVLVATDGPSSSDGWPPCFHQVRGYAYRGRVFTQVSGPTSFPEPVADLGQVDFRNTGLLVGIADPAGGGTVYCVPMANGTGTAEVYRDNDPAKGSAPYTFSLGPVSLFTDRFQEKVAVGLVTYWSDTGVTTHSVQLFTLSGSIVGSPLLVSGADGVTSIEQVQVSGDQLTVTLTAGGGTQAWHYAQSVESGTWQRTD